MGLAEFTEFEANHLGNGYTTEVALAVDMIVERGGV